MNQNKWIGEKWLSLLSFKILFSIFALVHVINNGLEDPTGKGGGF